MENTTLTISLPRTMKEFIDAKVGEGRFSTPSEYVRSLIRDDQDLTGRSDLAMLVRGGLLDRHKSKRSVQRRSDLEDRRLCQFPPR